MSALRRTIVYVCLLVGALSYHATVHAQSAPSLVAMIDTFRQEGIYQFDALEYDAAAADDAAYARLLPICGGTATPAFVATTTSSSCTGTTRQLFNQLRALEDNADQYLGRGETEYSLRLSPQGLGAALRWTAPEEYAAQGSLATRFANSQATVLSGRFAALRFATRLQALRGGDDTDGTAVAASGLTPFGGSAGADSMSWGNFSVFGSGSFGTGLKDPTTFEDAFSFDDTEASVGADYRLSRNWVVGLMAGHTEKRVDFNSELSVVAGSMRGNGQSIIAYAQYDSDAFYANGSFGIQHLSLATLRKITYPSNNPDVPSVNDTAYSDTGVQTLTGTLSVGYVFHYLGFSAEPYLSGQYTSVRINAFTEQSAEGFDFAVGQQDIHSAELDGGLRLEWAFLPPFGVIVPYLYGEYRHEFADASRIIDSAYTAADTSAPEMTLPTDAAPAHYYVVGAGGSIVLPHGLQGFIQYMKVLDYVNYSDHVVSGGIRWEL